MSSTEQKITFDQMPDAVAELLDKVEKLIDLVNEKFAAETKKESPADWMDINELIDYLPDHPTKPTVYNWVCARSIPFHKKTKKLSFSRKEIDEWMQNTGHATAEDMTDIALETFGYRKGGLR